jgi:hypothetical protein
MPLTWTFEEETFFVGQSPLVGPLGELAGCPMDSKWLCTAPGHPVLTRRFGRFERGAGHRPAAMAAIGRPCTDDYMSVSSSPQRAARRKRV